MAGQHAWALLPTGAVGLAACLSLVPARPGKFSHLDEALALLRPGGIYVIDDLLPQQNWPEGHAPKVPLLIDSSEDRPGFVTVRLAGGSGLMLVVRKPAV